MGLKPNKKGERKNPYIASPSEIGEIRCEGRWGNHRMTGEGRAKYKSKREESEAELRVIVRQYEIPEEVWEQVSDKMRDYAFIKGNTISLIYFDDLETLDQEIAVLNTLIEYQQRTQREIAISREKKRIIRKFNEGKLQQITPHVMQALELERDLLKLPKENCFKKIGNMMAEYMNTQPPEDFEETLNDWAEEWFALHFQIGFGEGAKRASTYLEDDTKKVMQYAIEKTEAEQTKALKIILDNY